MTNVAISYGRKLYVSMYLEPRYIATISTSSTVTDTTSRCDTFQYIDRDFLFAGNLVHTTTEEFREFRRFAGQPFVMCNLFRTLSAFLRSF